MKESFDFDYVKTAANIESLQCLESKSYHF